MSDDLVTCSDGPQKKGSPRSFALFLIDGFALMSYASIVEPFRAANVLSRQTLYRWRHVSSDGAPVRASNGVALVVDESLDAAAPCDALFVFAAGEPQRFADEHVLARLRDLAQRGITLGGVSGGPFLLARAGLLDGYRATIHWEHRPAFEETFPQLAVDPGLYVIDRRRVTCAGGTAGLDLALELIRREQGRALATRVGDWLIRGGARLANEPQRASLRDRYGVTHDAILKVLAHMEANVEEPASRELLARIAGVSVRQLERLFATYLGETPGKLHLRIRLDTADQLLRTTGLAVTAIGVACGFRSASAFSRAYRDAFGYPPNRRRAL